MRWLAWIALFGGLDASMASAGERGRPEVQVWVSQDFGMAPENTALAEAADGRILVSNSSGLLVFDGARWRTYTHPHKLRGLSKLAPDGAGRWYASWRGDLGWFAEDERGGFAWHSLKARTQAPLDGFSGVVYDARRRQVWYVVEGAVHRYAVDADELLRVREASGLSSAFMVGGSFWVHDPADGLLEGHGEPPSLRPLPGHPPFAAQPLLSAFEDARGTWVLTGAGTMFRRAIGSEAFTPFAVQHGERWRKLSRLVPTTYGYAVLSLEHSPELLDADGSLVDAYGPADGVPDNPTSAALEDRDGGLWLAQKRTIVRVDLGRGMTRFDAALGIKGASGLQRWRGVLFAHDDFAVYRLRPGAPARFERVLPALLNPLCLASVGGRLLVGGAQLFEVQGDPLGELEAKRLPEPGVSHCNELRAASAPERAYAAHRGGVTRIELREGRWQVQPLPQLQAPAFSLVEDGPEALLVANRSGGLWRIAAEPGGAAVAIASGLPAGPVRLYPGRKSPWLATPVGLRSFVDGRVVVPDGLPETLTTLPVLGVHEDHTGSLWVRGELPNSVLHVDGAGYRLGDELRGVSPNRTVFQYLREDDVLWLARSDDVLRIDLARQRPLAPPLPPRLRGVLALGTGESLPLSAPRLRPEQRSIRVEFATPSAYAHAANVYRTRLHGVDAEFTEFSPRSERELGNLRDGEHRFEFEARDAWGRVSAGNPLRIVVAPPWWRTPLAYGAWLAAFALALLAAARLGALRQRRRALARQAELEATVAARTEQLRASNLKLAEQAERLAEVDRLKTRFFVNVGHEFRTPLTLVLGPLDDLLRDARERLSLRAREQLELALRNAKRVLELIVELLDVNRFEHGQMRLQRQRIEIAPWLHRFVADQRALADRYGHALDLEVAGEPGSIEADPAHLERALANLVSNAAKYMARGGRIEIRAARAGEQVRIEVVDHGRGIAPAALPHVFDRFFQAEGGDRASGYGIGLALVREIVEAHGGSVAVASTPGVGSCFTLEWPALVESADTASGQSPDPREPGDPDFGPAPSQAETAGTDSVRTPSPASPLDTQTARTRRRVLVVDDHADLRRRVRELLASHHEVIEAEDGPSAWRAAQAELPDLIVADIMMPGFDGIELTRRLRADADTAAIGILLLTAMAGSEHAVAGLEAGANDYLAKPFDASELLARADAILRHAERLRLALQRAPKPAATMESASASVQQRWRTRLDAWVEEHLDDPDAGIDALAAHLHADRSTLFRHCKEALGMSPSEYLREARLKRAHELLARAAGNVAEVSCAAGFDSISGFTRAFKARFGEAPSAVLGRARAA